MYNGQGGDGAGPLGASLGVMGGRAGWLARAAKSCAPTRQSAQLWGPKPCRDEPSAWLMLLQIRWEHTRWSLRRAPAPKAQAPSGMGWLALPVALNANVVAHCQGMCHSFPLPLPSHSLSYPYGKKTSPVFQQQHKPEGKGESEAVACACPLPPGLCWWPGGERWAALRVSSKAGAVAGGRDGGRKRAASSRKLAAAPPGIPARWKPESCFLRRAGSASAPSSSCCQA